MTKTIRLMLAIFTTYTFSNIASAAPVQWIGNGHWYDLQSMSRSLSTWEGARDDATTRTFTDPNNGEILIGHLATITSAGENDFIDNTIGGIGWIGGYQTPNSSGPDQGWNWVTGEAWDYTNWSALEPNDQGPGSGDPLNVENNGENALEIWSNGYWNDFRGETTPALYVIEYEAVNAVPVPAAIWLFGSGLIGLAGMARRKKA